MPLSEQEKRALEELEAQLAADDPRFASAMVSDPQRRVRRRRILLGALGGTVGIGLLVLAVVIRQPLVGVLGFIAVTLAVAHMVGEPRRKLYVVGEPASQAATSGRRAASRFTGAKGSRPTRHGDFMTTLEDRWERRRRENQGW